MPSVELTRTSSQPSFKESCITAIVVVLSVESFNFVASPSFGDVGESDFLAKTDKILWTPWLDCFVPSVQLKMLKIRIQLQSKFRIFFLIVVYIGTNPTGTNPTFKVIFTPLEYIPTMSKTLHFFGSGFQK